MLRPATPLTLLLLAAFVLLLISVISVPIVKTIVLGEFDGVSYGVFGYCEGDDCVPIQIGYNPGAYTFRPGGCRVRRGCVGSVATVWRERWRELRRSLGTPSRHGASFATLSMARRSSFPAMATLSISTTLRLPRQLRNHISSIHSLTSPSSRPPQRQNQL